MAKDVLAFCLLGYSPRNNRQRRRQNSPPPPPPQDTHAADSVLAAMADDVEQVIDSTSDYSSEVTLNVAVRHTHRHHRGRSTVVVVSCMVNRKREEEVRLVRMPLFYIETDYRCVEALGDTVRTSWFLDKIDWQLTYRVVLERYIGLELSGANLESLGVRAKDRDAAFGRILNVGKESVSRCIANTRLSSQLGTMRGHLAAIHTMERMYGGNELAMRYHLLSGGSGGLPSVEVDRLKNLYTHRFTGDSFEDFCGYVVLRVERDQFLVDRLLRSAVADLESRRWMGYEFVDLLRKCLNEAFKVERIGGFDLDDDIDAIVDRYKRDRAALIARHDYTKCLYEMHGITVDRELHSFLQCKLLLYHPLYFSPDKNGPPQFRYPQTMDKPLNATMFSKQLRIKFREHSQSRCLPPTTISGAGGDVNVYGLSATPDTVYSGAHHVQPRETVLPCPIFTYQDGSTWRKIICSDPSAYPIADARRTARDVLIDYTPESDLDGLSYRLSQTILSIRHLAGSETVVRDLNEMFNGNLAIGAVPFDVDLNSYNNGFPPTFQDICTLCRGLLGVVKLFINLLRRHPHDRDVTGCELYCYKSECDYDDEELPLLVPTDNDGFTEHLVRTMCHLTTENDRPEEEEEEEVADWKKPCSCTKKVGLRVIVTLPPDVLFGSIMALASAAELLISFAKSDMSILHILTEFGGDVESALDTSVWAANKSLRIPYSRKPDGSRKLVPLYILADSDEAADKPRVVDKCGSLASDRFLSLAHRDYNPRTIPTGCDGVVVFRGCMVHFRDALDMYFSGCNSEMDIGGEETEDGGGGGEEESVAIDIRKEIERRLAKHFRKDAVDIYVESGLKRLLVDHLIAHFECGRSMMNTSLALDLVVPGLSALRFSMAPGRRPTGGLSQRYKVCLVEDRAQKSKKVLYRLYVRIKTPTVLVADLHAWCLKCTKTKYKRVTQFDVEA